MNYLEKDNLRILFQGDSITDGGRGRTDDKNHIMGQSYVYCLASKLGFEYPLKNYDFINRGVSGDKISDVFERRYEDLIDLKPDLLSLLIGVNGANHNVSSEDFEKIYRLLLESVKEALPETVIVLCEPFVLPVCEVKENWTEWTHKIGKRQDVVKKLSKEYKAIYVSLQCEFNKVLDTPNPDYWIWDGIHPTCFGHELIARKWLKVVSNK